jgi:serine/threonine protein kinase
VALGSRDDLRTLPAMNPALQRLLGRLKEGATSAGTPAPEATLGSDSPAAGRPADCAFLAPPQGPGEIGRLGPYRVVRLLGAGGMGLVLEAEDPQLKRHVALKVMRPALAADEGARRRFLREAQATAALEHDHVIPIYQVGSEGGLPFLAMPLLRGETLGDRLARAGRPPVAEALRIGREIAEGLAAAHDSGLIHRDIKPANTWLESRGHKRPACEPGAEPASGPLATTGGRVKILDFGLARPEVDDTHLTQTGTITGTPAYMAPEQATGEPIDHRCDLFSLGSVLYQMCTGRLPFPGSNPLAVLRALAVETPKPVRDLNPEVPPALAELTMRLLAKDPKDRPQTARAVANALAAIEEEQAGGPKPSRRRWLPRAGAALVLLALGVAGWLYGPAVYRVATNQGVVVIETDDPDVEVTVRGDVVKIVDVKTGNEVTLKAGKYQLELTKGKEGLKLSTREFTLERGGRQIVKVTRAAAAPAGKEPFLIRASEGRPEKAFAGLADAVAAAQSGDAIEVRGNGPFVSPPVNLNDKALTIRAGPGFRPVIQLSKDELPPSTPLLWTHAALVLEGLDLRRDDRGREKTAHVEYVINSNGAPIRLANCRFEVNFKENGGAVVAFSSPLFEARNCLVVSRANGTFADWVCPSGGRLILENNAVVATEGLIFHYRANDLRDASIRLARNTVSGLAAGLHLDTHPKLPAAKEGRPEPPLRLDASENVFATPGFVFALVQYQDQYLPGAKVLAAAEAESFLRDLLAWRERRNVYPEGVPFLLLVRGGR